MRISNFCNHFQNTPKFIFIGKVNVYRLFDVLLLFCNYFVGFGTENAIYFTDPGGCRWAMEDRAMDWIYYTWQSDTGYLVSDDGDILNGSDCKPARFTSAAEAEEYLLAEDIRGNVR